MLCAYCSTEDANKICTRCKSVRYCKEACQQAHWKTHKSICRVNDPPKPSPPPSCFSNMSTSKSSPLVDVVFSESYELSMPETIDEDAPATNDDWWLKEVRRLFLGITDLLSFTYTTAMKLSSTQPLSKTHSLYIQLEYAGSPSPEVAESFRFVRAGVLPHQDLVEKLYGEGAVRSKVRAHSFLKHLTGTKSDFGRVLSAFNVQVSRVVLIVETPNSLIEGKAAFRSDIWGQPYPNPPLNVTLYEDYWMEGFVKGMKRQYGSPQDVISSEKTPKHNSIMVWDVLEDLFYGTKGVAEKIVDHPAALQHAGPHLLASVFGFTPKRAREYGSALKLQRDYQPCFSLSSLFAEVLGISGMGANRDLLSHPSWSMESQSEILDLIRRRCSFSPEDSEESKPSSWKNLDGTALSPSVKLDRIIEYHDSGITAISFCALFSCEKLCRELVGK